MTRIVTMTWLIEVLEGLKHLSVFFRQDFVELRFRHSIAIEDDEGRRFVCGTVLDVFVDGLDEEVSEMVRKNLLFSLRCRISFEIWCGELVVCCGNEGSLARTGASGDIEGDEHDMSIHRSSRE